MASRDVGISIGILTDQLKRDAAEAKGIVGQLSDRIGTSFSRLQNSGVLLGAGIGAGAAAASAAVDVLVNAIGSAADRAIKLTDTFADIQKTSGMSRTEVEGLAQALSRIDTRTSLEGLLDIAKVGGQLGIAKSQLAGFVEATDRAVVALGDEFTGGVEEVTKSLGGLGKLFAETRDMQAGEQLERIGSAMNALGAAGSATSPVMAEFASRMGQLGQLAPGLSQSLALGAVLQELGLSAEIASGGLSNILLRAGENLPAFAAQVGMATAEFENLLNSDPNEVILRLAESFRGLSNTQAVAALGAMKVGSQEAVKVMSSLSGAVDMVREKQGLAAEEFAKATSLASEFAIKNNTLAANLEKIRKGIADMGIAWLQASGPMRFFAEQFETLTASVAGWFKVPVSQKLQEERISMKAMGLELQAANTSTERRQELLTQLQGMYPEHFKNLSLEKSSYGDIQKAIELANDALINKIILQKQSEKMAELQAQREQMATKAVEAREQLLRNAQRLSEQIGIPLRIAEGGDLKAQLNAFMKQVQQAYKSNPNYFDIIGDGSSRGSLLGKSMFGSMQEINEQIAQVSTLEAQLTKTGDAMKAMGQDYEELKRKFSASLGGASSTAGPVVPTSPTIEVKDPKINVPAEAIKKIQVDLIARLNRADMASLPVPAIDIPQIKLNMVATKEEQEQDFMMRYLDGLGISPDKFDGIISEVAAFSGALSAGMVDAFAVVADGLAQAMDPSLLPEQRKNAFLRTIGDFLAGMLRRLGTMLISAGVAMEGFKKSLIALFASPATAIAAGIAMVATGVVIQASLKAAAMDEQKRAKNIPAFYNGGIIPGSPNGMLAQVGERNQSEAIIPLRRLHEFTGGGQVVHVQGSFQLGHDALEATIEKIQRKKRS